jgi:L-fuconolactonase
LVDAYAHVSKRKYQPVEALLKEMKTANVVHAVIVQPLNDYDNSYLEMAIRRQADQFTGVAVLDMSASNAEMHIENLIVRQGFAGVRVDPRGGGLDEFFSKLAELSSVVMLHLPDGIGANILTVDRIARKWPDLRICLPHLGWPHDAHGPTHDWADAINRLAQLPNTAVVVSALYYFSQQPFPHEDTWAWIDHAIECFGAERTMFGSDFPLLLQASSYANYFAQWSQSIFADAARRFWRIGPSWP